MSRHRFNHVPVILAFFTLALTISGQAVSADDIAFLQPQRNETITGQAVTVKLSFSRPIDLATFSATLNGKDVTSKFSLNASGGSAVLALSDGENLA